MNQRGPSQPGPSGESNYSTVESPLPTDPAASLLSKLKCPFSSELAIILILMNCRME